MLSPKLIPDFAAVFRPKNWKQILVGLVFLGFGLLTLLPVFHSATALLGIRDMYSAKLAQYPALAFACYVSATALIAYCAYFKWGPRSTVRTKLYLLSGVVLIGVCSMVGLAMRWI